MRCSVAVARPALKVSDDGETDKRRAQVSSEIWSTRGAEEQRTSCGVHPASFLTP